MPRRREFRVEEADVEVGVVDHEFGAFHEGEEFRRDVGERRLRGEELVGDAVHRERARVDFAVRLQVAMPVAAGRPAVHELDAADLDDAVTFRDLESGRFGVKDDLAHGTKG